VGIVINVGEPILTLPGQFLNVVGGYCRAIDVFAIATAAVKDSGRAKPPAPDGGTSDAVVWTFADRHPLPGRRVRVRGGPSGYVHAGVAQPDGRWDPLYDVPLVPQADGSWEALLPRPVNAFTFFWTEPPRSPGRPGHWERERQGGACSRLREAHVEAYVLVQTEVGAAADVSDEVGALRGRSPPRRPPVPTT
jgi:hypothetical protein